jgi:hypothetical protein
MDLTLDYNVELFPLQKDHSFALALASSLARGGTSGNTAEASQDETNENERDVWRPDGKGSRGLEDEYDYVMYGKVCLSKQYIRFPRLTFLIRSTSSMEGVGKSCMLSFNLCFLVSYQSQDSLYLVWWASHVLDWFIPAYDEYRSWGPRLSPHAKIVFPLRLLATDFFGPRPQLSLNPAPLFTLYSYRRIYGLSNPN